MKHIKRVESTYEWLRAINAPLKFSIIVAKSTFLAKRLKLWNDN